jgi:2'-5' RNA ligase
LPLEKYRDILNSKYNRDYIEDNNYDFLPHITFLKIKNVIEFEKHRTNIEDLLRIEINKLNNSNINKNNCFLYAVNSAFKEEIQIKI